MIQVRHLAIILIAACLARTATEATAGEPHGRAYLFRGLIDLIVGVLSLLTMIGFAAPPSMAQPRAHVYLLRGLMNIFSLARDTLAEKIQRHGIYATIHNYAEWQTLADQAAAAYHAGKEGPIIIVGHSLGADAVMEMSAYLGRKGVPVALAVPFDARGSYATPSNLIRRMI